MKPLRHSSPTITNADQLAWVIKVIIPLNYLWFVKQYIPLDKEAGDEIKTHQLANKLQATVYLHSHHFSADIAVALVNFSNDIFKRTGETVPHSITIVPKEVALRLQNAS